MPSAVTIKEIEPLPVRLRRDLQSATGTAGSPTRLGPEAGAYRWSSVFPVLYSEYIETCLVKVTLSNGLYGWGESQAPLAPRVAATIIEDLLGPVLQGTEFGGTAAAVDLLWRRMYQTMRVRGQTGGFMLDAISGIDIALWDLAGKMQGAGVANLLSSEPKPLIPAYLSGVSGTDQAARVEFARRYHKAGFRVIKVFHDRDEDDLLALLDALRNGLGPDASIAIDCLWRLELPGALKLLGELEQRNLYWLEAPFAPEEISWHKGLRSGYNIPLAVGESYRTRYELAPYLENHLVRFLQPDLGRSGISESWRIGEAAAKLEMSIVPHVSIALGPQIAAAIHLAAALPNCNLCEYNPSIFDAGNRYLLEPIALSGAAYSTPAGPGLGIDMREDDLRRDTIPFGK